MMPERMELEGLERARYYVPTVICAYLAAMCLTLVVTSAFLVTLQKAVAVTAAGLFGLALTGGLGMLFWRAQRRDLRFTRLATPQDPGANFAAVQRAAQGAGWRLICEEPGVRIEATSSVTLLDAGERISVRFHGNTVLVACICDPSIGFSLVGRRHCADHREIVRSAVSGASLGEIGRT